MTRVRAGSTARTVIGATLVAAAYVVTGRLGLALGSISFVTLVWPPTGIALFALTRVGLRVWPAIFIGAFVTNLLVRAPLAACLGIAIGNTLEAVAGAYLLRKTNTQLSLARIRDVIALVGFAVIGSTLVSAAIGVATLLQTHVIEPAAALKTLRAWWLGDALGNLVVAPALMVWSEPPRDLLSRPRAAEALALVVVLLVSAALVFGDWPAELEQGPLGEPYFLFPMLIWAAVRFSQRGAVASTLLISVVGVASTVSRRGPFVKASLTESLLALQMFMAVSALTELVLAAAVAERNRAAEAAERSGRIAGFLVRAGDLLASSLDLEVTLENVARLAVPTIAESCLVRTTAIEGSPRRVLETVRPGVDEAAMLRLEREATPGASRGRVASTPVSLTVPLVARGQPLGAITLARLASQEPYSADDITLADELGQRAAMALDNARLFRETEAERSRAERAEVEMRNERQQARTIAEAIPQLVWSSLPDGTTDYVNTMWREYTGLNAEESSGRAWRQLVHPDEAESVREQWTHSRETGEPYEMEVRMRRASDGNYRWMLIRAVPLRDDLGKLIRWLGTCTDVDEQKQLRENTTFLAQASAVLSESLDYQGTLAKLAELVVPRMADWCIIHLKDGEGVVPQLLALAHSDPERVKWARAIAKASPSDPDAPRGPYHVVSTGVPELYPEITEEMLTAAAQNADQLRAIHGLQLRSAMVLPLQARGRTFGAITLMTAESGRKYTEADLAVAKSLAERAAYAVDNARLFAESQQAIRSREEFLSIASHELRTPLTALELQVGSLRRAAAKTQSPALDKINAKLDTIHRQIERLTKLIDNLLDVSRIMVGRFTLQLERVDFAEVVEDVIKRFREQLGKAGCELRLHIDRACIGTWDRLRLDQILTNLISNAIKYGQGKPIEIALRSVDESAVLTVRDFGIGIRPEDQARIFERFERAVSQRHFGGLGLGLWIVKQIVTALAGRIEVASAAGEGATFTVTLPKHPPVDFPHAAEGTPVTPFASLQ